jgi:hypothetical protein
MVDLQLLRDLLDESLAQVPKCARSALRMSRDGSTMQR